MARESASCVGPENVDRKLYPQKLGQNSRNTLIIVRSQWTLIVSLRGGFPRSLDLSGLIG
jgi:hypothetical protein